MALSPAQLLTLKAAIAAETDPAFVQARTDGSTGTMAELLNVESTVVVWRSSTLVQTVFNSINWANLTPNDAADSTQAWANRALMCQGKQANVQTMLGGQSQISTGFANVRAGLQDALTNLPSGAGGAIVAAGWTNVRLAIQRLSTKGEKVFATGTGTAASPAELAWEGRIENMDVVNALRA